MAMASHLRDVDDLVALPHPPEVDRLVGAFVELLEEGCGHFQQVSFDRGTHAQLEDQPGEAVPTLDAFEEARTD